ncbi:MAG: HD-GYP domain-containing protein (c-di-GMP phosphodiesterase class II) [Halioglobus sp.]|jgi:HD-GYP domain-containing protein (c-di-GMP phosphodiesterase class II)
MLNTLKINISDLDIGMYVSGLDRPWLETPFLTQGFLIESREDIEQLREYCNYVLVDGRKSRQRSSILKRKVRKTQASPNAELVPSVGTNYSGRSRIPAGQIFDNRTIKPYHDKSDWKDERPLAQKAVDTLVEDINEIFSQVSDGGRINIIKLKKSIEPIVDSITRNPDACLWVSRLKNHDEYTYQHSLGSAIWSVSLGRQLGLPRHDLRSLAMGCMLMDVGKLRVDTKLLKAKRKLNLEETAQMAGHVSYGLDIIKESGLMNQDVIDMVAHHHERFDGTGYPNGLTENQIPAFARIAAIVDTYDAVTSQRSYAPAISPAEAIRLLYKSRDEDFQAELVEAFIQAVGIYPAGTLVELSSGEVGVVVAEYRTHRLRPKVMLLLDKAKNELPVPKVIDLQEDSASDDIEALTITKGLDPDAYGIDLSKVDF